MKQEFDNTVPWVPSGYHSAQSKIHIGMGCIPSCPVDRSSLTTSSKSLSAKRQEQIPPTKKAPKRTKKKSYVAVTIMGPTVQRRLPDRKDTSFSSTGSSDTKEYIERMVSEPEYDEELQMEITRRQNSIVRANVNKYDQLEAKSRFEMPLMEVRSARLSQESGIFARVQSFEDIVRESNVEMGPSLEKLRQRREEQSGCKLLSSSLLPLYVYSL